MVAEYLNRRHLSELGYTFGANELDILTAEAFVIIGTEFQRLREKKDGRQGNNRA